MKKTINDLYTRVLELTDKVLSLLDERTAIHQEIDILSARNGDQEQTISILRSQLSSLSERHQECLTGIAELEETAATLMQWNSSLEQQCDTLTFSVRQQKETASQMQSDLHEDLLTATKKQINKQGEIDLLDEENTLLRRTLRESRDIQDRLSQENAILKSKIYNMYTTHSAETPLSLSALSGSPEMEPRMENVKLDSRHLGIGDILKQLKIVTLR